MTHACYGAPMTSAASVRPARPPAVHGCATCAALPERPLDEALVDPDVEYRPKVPRKVVSGGPRSGACKTHERVIKQARRERSRLARGRKVYGLPDDLQRALWTFQGRACPCGRKAAPTPSGIATDHVHELAELHDHPVEQGCPECVTAYLCPHCNTEVVGKLTRHWPRERVALALVQLASVLFDPPLARLRRGEATPYLTPHELAAVLAEAQHPTPKGVAA